MLYYTLLYFIILGDTENFVSWKSKGLSAERLTTPTTIDHSLSPSIKWYRDSNFCLVFKGRCLRQKNTTFTLPNERIYFIVYELVTSHSAKLRSEDVLRTSQKDILWMSHMVLCVTPKDVPYQLPEDVLYQRPQDVERRRPEDARPNVTSGGRPILSYM